MNRTQHHRWLRMIREFQTDMGRSEYLTLSDEDVLLATNMDVLARFWLAVKAQDSYR